MEKEILALPCSDPEFPEPVVLKTLKLSLRNIEQAGEAHLRLTLKKLGLLKEEDMTEDEDAGDEEDEEELSNIDKAKLAGKKRKKPEKNVNKMNFYDALGIGHIGLLATEKDVRSAHRKMVVKYHPDKVGAENYDEDAKARWLLIQEGYETLIDADKKKRYDSTLEFNEFVPDDKEYSENDFFVIFGPVFKRNGHFSKTQPVPDLGTLDTPIKKVMKFYDFWVAFKSWRDFVHEDEYDLEQAENRWERRHMEKENKKLKSKLYKKEKMRIKKLVTIGKKRDPRVVKHEEEKRKEREARRLAILEKKRLKRQAEEDRKLKILEKKRQKEEEERRKIEEKKMKEKEKREKKGNFIKKITALCDERIQLPEYNEDFLEIFLGRTKPEENDAVLEILENRDTEKEALIAQFKEWIKDVKDRCRGKKKKKNKDKDNKKKEVIDEMASWTEKELRKLTKGIVKFPAGVKSRWQLISAYVGGKKTVKQCNKMSEILSVKRSGKVGTMDKRLEKVMEAKKKIEKKMKEKEENAWSQEQQSFLEKGIKKYPSSLGKKERWTKIASEVEGKTPKECFARVKEIRKMLASKKKG